jgi:hypothetical protein
VNLPGARSHENLRNYPPVEDWDHHVEYDAKAHPRKVPHTYSLIPTICFNCESSCGLLAYVDHEDLSIKKFEGNPAREGPGDDQPGPRPRADPVPAEAGRRTGLGPVRAGLLGQGGRRHRGPDP